MISEFDSSTAAWIEHTAEKKGFVTEHSPLSDRSSRCSVLSGFSAAMILFILVFSLSGCGSQDARMLEFLQSEDPNQRLTGLLYFSESPEPVAKSYVILMLEDESMMVRQAAFTSLAARPDHNVTTYMNRALEKGLLSDDPYSLRRYVQAWGLLGGKSALDAIARVIPEADPILREVSMQSLCMMSSLVEKSLDSISQAMTPPFFEVLCEMASRTGNYSLASRLAAMADQISNRPYIKKMAQVMGPAALRGYGPYFRSANPGLKFWILSLLGELGCGDVENILLISLNQENQALAVRALEALSMAGKPSLARALMPSVVRFLIINDRLCALKAVEVITRSEMAELSAHLMNAYYRFGGEVGKVVMSSLVSLGATREINLLLDSHDPAVRGEMAVTCIIAGGAQALQTPLRGSLENFVRREYDAGVKSIFAHAVTKHLPFDSGSELLKTWEGSIMAGTAALEAKTEKNIPVKTALGNAADLPGEITQGNGRNSARSDEKNPVASARPAVIDYLDGFPQLRATLLNYSKGCSTEYLIMDHLFDSDSESRRWAVERAGTQLGERSVLAMAPLLDFMDPRGVQVVDEMAGFGKGALAYLRLMTARGTPLRLKRIIRIIVSIGDSAGFDIIKPLLTHRDRSVRMAAIRAMKAFGFDGMGELKLLLKANDLFSAEKREIHMILDSASE
ncbi:MAG: hypothetical protein CVV64_08905 [Candidatus Wallbacteria bacterium HGW-Wallbacteria-1]|uniref:HEAT repeat domain-containing protein n=1 Tax=Candidatus Wallbacteria bacterium HGW-Wallbacteria-1 TaxID=2013854 RepID=A0A2N1PQ51_9BACT|nr:MAG: hypothetical protein CVV64_08905 [Candidatus Wallbacteria bacterium HGW-Wallbacteria-1]